MNWNPFRKNPGKTRSAEPPVSESPFENYLGWNLAAETGTDSPSGSPVTEILWQRLSENTRNLIAQRMAEHPEWKKRIERVDGAGRMREILRFGALLAPEELRAETGLFRFSPPENVHAMVREEVYCGDLFYNDMIVAELEKVGRPVQPDWRVLDFGSSSGRVIHPFSLAFPDTRCFGCDPLRDAAEWATENLPGVDFHQSPLEPPLRFESESFDFVFAVSIWSHFGKEAGRAWREEMRRILKPGGLFAWTTHGPGALLHYCDSGAVRMEDGERFFRDLHRNGFAFYNPFGESGDWGIVSEQWGQAFLHPSYVLRETLTGWKTLAYRSRMIENNQDFWLFEKT